MNDRDQLSKVHGLENLVRGSACPIVGVQGSRASFIGSGFLLRVGERTVLVTAAHVMDRRWDWQLQIPGQTRTIPFDCEIFSTGPASPLEEKEYGLDLAFAIIRTDSLIEPLSRPVHALDSLDADDLAHPWGLYGFVGCPGAANSLQLDRTFDFTSYYYGGVACSKEDYDLLQYSMLTHFLMKFDRERMIDREGREIAVPPAWGMSGGPVWRLGTRQQCADGSAVPKIIGVTIEWPERRGVLVAVRVSMLLESLRRLVPEFEQYISKPKHVSFNAKVVADREA